MALDVRDVITTVELTLLELLDLGLSQRLAPAADLAALAALPVLTTGDGKLIYVVSESNLYRWKGASTAAHGPPLVVQPSSLPPNGRWHRVSSMMTYGPNTNAPLQRRPTGYVHAVDVYQSTPNLESWLEHVFGEMPFVLIHWTGDNPEARSLRSGALYWNVLTFTIQCGSSNLRPGPATRHGSPIPTESAIDPGLHRLMGDVRYLLAGCQTGVDGIESIEIGPSSIVADDLEERVHVANVDIVVRTSFGIPDEDLVDPLLLQVDPQFPVDFIEQPAFDAQNYVASGFRVAEGPGLTRSFGPSSAVVGGVAIATTPAPHTFMASKRTYRDLLPAGTLVFLEVGLDMSPPPLTPTALRIGYTDTDITNVVADKITCSCSFGYGPPLLIP